MSNRPYSESIASVINGFLTDDEWNYTFDQQKGLFRFNLSLKGKINQTHYIINVFNDAFAVYAISPLGADSSNENMMSRMAEFVCRANYGLSNGNFEIDMSDGEIRYKIFADCEDIAPSPALVRNSIFTCAAMFERYSDGIVDIIFNNASAKDAVEKCEANLQAEANSAEAPTASLEEQLHTVLGDEDMSAEDMQALIAYLLSQLGN